MSKILTWHERAMRHPDHQSGMVSEDMIRARMCEEIGDLRAEVERLREVLKIVRINGPDAQGLVWLSFSREGGVRVSFAVSGETVSQALLEFEQIRRKALEAKP